ncbi:hypothetical protein E8E13_009625 [Curvularia kusanoi]|uniref:Uncharacterized protein n=1 Tax=Curvularia kusanoi TaxID=90978 RepID=A0A9P4WAW5_CURKU|nr:hypothetical protein E8E13_009625 [Curvularia kusanoi]
MASPTLIIASFLLLGLLNLGIITLSVLYWFYSGFLGLTLNLILCPLFFSTIFIIYPLLTTLLISFTLAPSLLAARETLSAHFSSNTPSFSITSLIPSFRPSIPLPPLTTNDKSSPLPTSAKQWLTLLMSGYAGYKALGALPGLMMLLAGLAMRGGREEVEAGPGRTQGGASPRSGSGETGLSVRSEDEVKETGLSVRVGAEEMRGEGRSSGVAERGVGLRKGRGRGKGRGRTDLQVVG